MIQIAKAVGMKTMLGCVISSAVSVTAAGRLSPLVDFADLEGNPLISNDPCPGRARQTGHAGAAGAGTDAGVARFHIRR